LQRRKERGWGKVAGKLGLDNQARLMIGAFYLNVKCFVAFHHLEIRIAMQAGKEPVTSQDVKM